MKGVFVRGNDIAKMLEDLTYAGNLIDLYARQERLFCMFQLNLIDEDTYWYYLRLLPR